MLQDVHLPVRLSVTLRYGVKTVKRIVEICRSSVIGTKQRCSHHQSTGCETLQMAWQNSRFSTISYWVSETAQDESTAILYWTLITVTRTV